MKIEQMAIGAGLIGGLYWWYTRQAATTTPNPTGTTPVASGAPPTTGTTPSGAQVTNGTNNPPAGGGNNTPPTATPPAYVTPPPVTAGPVNTGATPISGGSNTNALIIAAAGGDRTKASILNGIGVRLTADEWNWYRSQNPGKGDTTADLFPEGNRGYAMSASEYLDRRATAGLSGMGGGIATGLRSGGAFRSAGSYTLRRKGNGY